MRAIAAAHTVFGVIMGYFYGKYLVTGQKKYAWLSFVIPLVCHTVTNTLAASMDLSKFFDVTGKIAALSRLAAIVIVVIAVLRRQKDRTLDVPALQKKQQINREERNDKT